MLLPDQFQQLLEKFSRGGCSPEEEQLVIDWYNNIGRSEKSHLREEEKAVVEERLWSAINPDAARKRTWLPLLTRAAAVTIPLMAATIFFIGRQSVSDLITMPGTEEMLSNDAQGVFRNDGQTARTIALSDGSEVVLQPSSEIIVDRDFGGATREVRLKGEAFFKVHRNPGKPFVVYSNEVVTRVLGTSFNICAYESDREITVAVRTGKVSVYTNKSKDSGVNSAQPYHEVILTPNQQMVYHRVKEEVSKELVKKPEIILPNSDLFRMQFENAEVSKILEVLQENYGVVIRYDEEMLNHCRLTTSMSDEGLYERIEVICKAIGASYLIDDDAAITIKSSGC
jgi:ferric-dicitrate binding protein FerR (iron transport regulator)